MENVSVCVVFLNNFIYTSAFDEDGKMGRAHRDMETTAVDEVE